MKKWDGRVSLAMKLNMVLIASILICTFGLIMVSISAYTFTVQDAFSKQADVVLDRAMESLDMQRAETLVRLIENKEFQAAHTAAEQNNDVMLFENWMRTHTPEGNAEDGSDTLLADYQQIYQELFDSAYPSSCDRLYLQYEKDGVTYIVAEAYENILFVGKVQKEHATFDEYQDNEPIKSTVYWTGERYNFVKSEPVYRQSETGGMDTLCTLNIEWDVDSLMQGRYVFVLYSVLFSLAVIAAIIALSTWITRKNVSTPLNELAKGATAFGRESEGYTVNDVLSLDIHTEDEIEDLYQEIRSMQTRIVNYTQNIARVTAERERVGTELRMASSIQEGILPSRFPAFPDRKEFDLHASMDPAKEVGGDFYDFFLVDEDHLAILIADVSDKGVPAALFMMSSKILLDYRTKLGGTPAEILTAVNRELAAHNEAKMFITVWLGILNTKTGHLICSNAGHEFPAIGHRDGTFRLYEDEHGLVLGALEKAAYTDYELTLAPGDTLFVYTDGVTDAKSEAGEFYGTDRMIATLNRAAGQSPEEILHTVRADIDNFIGWAQQFDDLTMLCMTYYGNAAESEEEKN